MDIHPGGLQVSGSARRDRHTTQVTPRSPPATHHKCELLRQLRIPNDVAGDRVPARAPGNAPAGGHRCGCVPRPAGASGVARWGRRGVSGCAQPSPGPAAAAVLAETPPPVEHLRPSRQDILEPAERSTPGDRDAQPVRHLGVIKTGDEQLHVPVAGTRPLGADPQPPTGIIVLIRIVVAELLSILECELRPHHPGLQVDPATAIHRIAFQHAGELLQVDRQGLQQRRRSVTKRALELVGELGVPLPVAVLQRVDAAERQFVDSCGLGTQRGPQTITDQLQGILGPRPPRKQADQGFAVATGDRASHPRPVFPTIHAGHSARLTAPAVDQADTTVLTGLSRSLPSTAKDATAPGAGVRKPAAHRARPGRWTGVENLRAGVGLYFVAVLAADLRHFLDLPDDAPGPARRLAAQLGGLVRAATAAEPGPAWISALPCRRRPGHRACPGRMTVARTGPAAPIVFECTDCGDGGMISGWQDSPYDCRHGGHPRTAAAGVTLMPVPVHVADTLRDLTFLDRNCDRVVYGARFDRGDAVLAVTRQELEELIGSVAAEANHEPDRRRRRRLDAAFDTLDNAALDAHTLPAGLDVTRGDAGGQPAATQATKAGLPDLDVARAQR